MAAQPPAPDPDVAAPVRPRLAARRRGRGDRGHGADRAEEPRLRRHRRRAAAERAVRRGGRRDHLRAVLHLAADLDRAELVAGGGRRRRGARDRPRRRAGGASSSPRSRSSTGVLFLLLAVLRMGWIAQFLSKAVITGFLAGAAVDVVIGELPKLTGTSADGDQRLAGARRRGSARSATSTGRRWSSASSRSP